MNNAGKNQSIACEILLPYAKQRSIFFIGGFYKFALSDFEIIFEVKL